MTAPQLEWAEASAGFWRDTTGRFDVFWAHAFRCWVAIDWDRGCKVRRATLEAAQAWCLAAVSVKEAA